MTPRPPHSLTVFPLKALGLSVTLALGALLPTAQSLAAEDSSASVQRYAIAPGPLNQVLAQFAASAGVPLSFDPALLGNRQSSGLQGEYNVQEGFARLLQGSGLSLSSGANGYTLVPQGQRRRPGIGSDHGQRPSRRRR